MKNTDFVNIYNSSDEDGDKMYKFDNIFNHRKLPKQYW